MSADTIYLPHGPAEAVRALVAASTRLEDAFFNQLKKGGDSSRIWAALSECLYWVAALDDHALKAAKSQQDYRDRRAGDLQGRIVGALTYARNMHAHELAATGGIAAEIPPATVVVTPAGQPLPPPSSGIVATFELYWIPFGALGRPINPGQFKRDEWYRDLVGGRPMVASLEDAAAWFRREFAL